MSSCGSDVTTLPQQNILPEQNTQTQTASNTPAANEAPPLTTERARCSSAAVIQPRDPEQRELIRLSDSTASGSDTSRSSLGGCDGATSGPEVWYELNLQTATRAVDVRAIVDAGFDAALDLRQGPCADTLSLDCDRASAFGAPSSALATRLDPGVYWLVVDGKDSASHGDFQLQVELDPGNGACPEAPVNLTCETALPLSTQDLQTVLVDSHCTTLDHASMDREGRYYSLDLSAEVSPVVAELSQWNFGGPRGDDITVYREAPDTSGCGVEIANDFLGSRLVRAGAEVATLLEPGRYIIELRSDVVEETAKIPSALTVRLDRATCRSGPLGNTCEDAIELESAPGAYLLEGSTLCNSDHVTLAYCNEYSTADQFYRLDLRAESVATRARVTVLIDGLGMVPLMYLLADDGSGGCGRGLYCVDFFGDWEGTPHYDWNLEPALYFIGVESAIPGSGSYRLLVELDRTVPSPCVTSAIDNCVFRNHLAGWCCDANPLATAECADFMTVCGLASETQRCVCEKNAACCGGAGDTTGCPEAYAACNFLCPEFAPSPFACVEPYG